MHALRPLHPGRAAGRGPGRQALRVGVTADAQRQGLLPSRWRSARRCRRARSRSGPSRMIHFFDPSNPKMAAKVPDLAKKVRRAARQPRGRDRGRQQDRGARGPREDRPRDRLRRHASSGRASTASTARGCSTTCTTLVAEIGDKLDVIMIPKVEGPWDIHYVDQLLAQLEAKAGLREPLLDPRDPRDRARAWSTSRRSAAASPRMQGLSFGPADLAASRRMKTTRVGGGHPRLPRAHGSRSRRTRTRRASPRSRTSGTTRWRAWSTRAPRHGILPYYGPFGDIDDPLACEDQFRDAFLMGCVGAWSLHPSQIEIARKVFSPPRRRGALGAQA